MLGTLTILHFSLFSINSLNLTATVAIGFSLHFCFLKLFHKNLFKICEISYHWNNASMMSNSVMNVTFWFAISQLIELHLMTQKSMLVKQVELGSNPSRSNRITTFCKRWLYYDYGTHLYKRDNFTVVENASTCTIVTTL